MKCLILAAGYATRLYPLTESFPKPLLRVGEKTIIDWLIDDLSTAGKIDEFIIISNHKFAHHFDEWAEEKNKQEDKKAQNSKIYYKITVVDDGTSSNETRLGAVKDIEFAKYHVYPQGYMVRMSPESYREQVRVSKDAVKHGISFRSVGMRYIEEYKKNPNVISATVIFLTDASVDYAALKALAKKSVDVTGTLTHILEGLPTDCSVCALKDICDEVEGMKELHFGVGAKGTDHH